MDREAFDWQGSWARDFQELHFEGENGIPGNRWSGSSFSVGQIRWDLKTIDRALFHELQTFGPAFDDLIQQKSGGLTPVPTAIEHRSVRQGSDIVNRHF